MKPPDPDNIAETLRIRTSVLDGATATMLAEATAAAHLPLADLLCLEHPKNVEALHKAYLDAGADIISTNTFNANALILEKFYHAKTSRHVAENINRAAASMACQCTRHAAAHDGHRRYVAGIVAPICPKPGDSAEEWLDACQAQMAALAESGVDLLLAESCYNIAGTRIVAQAAARIASHYNICTAFSAMVNDNGTLPMGGELEDLLDAVAVASPSAVGLNCCNGPQGFVRLLRKLKTLSPYPTIAYPGAGLPDSAGRYPVNPQDFGQMARTIIAEDLASAIGGCCGTTPAHIAAVAQAVHDSGK